MRAQRAFLRLSGLVIIGINRTLKIPKPFVHDTEHETNRSIPIVFIGIDTKSGLLTGERPFLSFHSLFEP